MKLKAMYKVLVHMVFLVLQTQAYRDIEQISPNVFVVRMKSPPLVTQYHSIMSEAIGDSYLPSSAKLDFGARYTHGS